MGISVEALPMEAAPAVAQVTAKAPEAEATPVKAATTEEEDVNEGDASNLAS